MNKLATFTLFVSMISISYANRKIEVKQEIINLPVQSPPIIIPPCEESRCNFRCADIYQPVCAQNCEGRQVTFSNACYFNLEQCLKPEEEWSLLYDGECQTCNPICTAIYDPVCARSCTGEFITFGNLCEMNYQKCLNPEKELTFLYEGECCRCNIACTRDFNPVCARDCNGILRVFGNQCQLEVERCLYPEQKWSLVCEGECPLLI